MKQKPDETKTQFISRQTSARETTTCNHIIPSKSPFIESINAFNVAAFSESSAVMYEKRKESTTKRERDRERLKSDSENSRKREREEEKGVKRSAKASQTLRSVCVRSSIGVSEAKESTLQLVYRVFKITKFLHVQIAHTYIQNEHFQTRDTRRMLC